MRFLGELDSVEGVNGDDEVKLCRLSCLESGDVYRSGLSQYSREGYDPSVFPTGLPIGSREECFDCEAMGFIHPMASPGKDVLQPLLDGATVTYLSEELDRPTSTVHG